MIIYKITNLTNNKIYIGKTVLSLERRMQQHLSKSKKNTTMLISRAIAKYGIQNFKVEQIDSSNNESELNKLERYWIDFYHSNDLTIGYNLTGGGDGGDIIKNLPNKEEIYSRRADSNRGKKRSAEFKKQNSVRHKGKKLSDDTKQKLRAANIGKITSSAIKQKISKSLKGRKFTDTHKLNISIATKGKPHIGSRKRIIIDGIKYNSLTEASTKLNLTTSIIHYRLNSKKYDTYNYE